MNKPLKTLLASLAAVLAVVSGVAAETQARPKIVRPASTSAIAATFSTEVPLVQRYVPPANGQSGTLVLNAAHSFNVTLTATNQHNGNVQGPGVALPQNDLFGYFSLPSLTANPSNPEVFVKILDGRPVNGKWWVFYGHLTDLIYDLSVRENATGITKVYHKDAGNAVGGFDTGAFSSTPPNNLADTEGAPLTPNAFVRTAIDISNNTNSTITVNLQYSYTCTAATCPIVNNFYRTSASDPNATISILGFGSFHQDDIVQYLGSQGLLQTGADQGSNGTLLVTFNGVPSNIGWEATAEARTYNRVLEPDPLRGTVGFGMNGSLFFESTNTSLTGTVRDTRPAPTLEGSLTSHVGIRNTDIFGPPGDNTPVSVDVSLFDPATGQRVGNIIPVDNVLPGEVRVINDIFTAAGVAGGKSLILFADVRNHTASSPTIEGFILVQDTYSGDTRAHELRCADLVHCGP
jgi:hypothetical protein